MIKRILPLLAAFLILIPALSQDDQQSIVDIAVANENFSTLVAALQVAELVETLQGDGPFTVFAPTDDAFNRLEDGLLEYLLENTDVLTEILLYHVVAGNVMAADVLELEGESVETVGGESVTIRVANDLVFVNDAIVVAADIAASNGVIHVIDTVLIPDSVLEMLANDDNDDD